MVKHQGPVTTTMKVLVTLSLLVSASFCAQVYPGTPTRPILSDQEAAQFTKPAYLQKWVPPAVSVPATASFTVGGAGGFKTIQAAVNAAIKAGGTTRKYIEINAGVYVEVVYIPPTTVPITLYGAGGDASSTVISLSVSASSGGAGYKTLVGHLFNPGDPAYGMYSSCAGRSVIATECSSVVWSKANNLQIINLTIENLSSRQGVDQAVALYTEGDLFQVSRSRILGHQSTFWSGAIGSNLSRGHVTDTYIGGDVGFVFGGGSTVFERCTFHARDDRGYKAVVFAPATAAAHKYGFLVIDSKITGDSSFFRYKSVLLAIAFDIGIRSASAYRVGISPNGQLVIRESTIDDIIPFGSPYLAATSGRLYAGNANRVRDLNDHHYNRFWEHANTGNGA